MRGFPLSLTQSLERQGEGLTILVVRLAALGDVLRTLPAVRLLRRALPRCRLHWVVDDRWSSVLRGHADLDGLLEFPRRQKPRFGAALALHRQLRALDADLALDFHGNLRSGITGWFSGATVRLGYSGHQAKELNPLFNTHRVPARSRRTPRIERNLDLVRELGIADGPLSPSDLPFVAAGRASAREIVRELLGDRPYGVISPGASLPQAYKKPPPAALAAAAPALSNAGARTLVVWGPGEEADARRVVALCGDDAMLAPATDLAALAALIEGARLYIGGDSGPLHLACAVGVPVLGVYGPTDPIVNGPWGVESRIVFPEGRVYTGVKRVDRRAGFDGLRPEQIAAAVTELTDPHRTSGSASPAQPVQRDPIAVDPPPSREPQR